MKQTIDEVAWCLSNMNRCGGHLGQYSVGQHSCLVCDMLGGSFNGLGHDFHETIVTDVPTPLKNALNLLGNNIWRNLEYEIAKKVRLHWGMTNPMPPSVKAADAQAFRIEIASLASNSAKSSYMSQGIEPLYGTQWHIHDVWSPDRTYDEIMDRFNKYGPTGRKR